MLGGTGQLVMELDSQQGGAPNNLVQARFKIIDAVNGYVTSTDGLPGLLTWPYTLYSRFRSK